MELKLINTEYNFDCLGNQVKACLGFHDGKASIDLYINNALAYYYIIHDLKTLMLDDTELIELAAFKIFEVMESWLRDCSILKTHFRDFKLVNKISIFTFSINDIIFFLRLSTEEKKDKSGYLFRLEYTNDSNRDVLDSLVEAKDYDELIKKTSMYARSITEISGLFEKNSEQFMRNAFSKHFYG